MQRALVLDRTTGLVSPQFHMVFDPSFNTVKQDKFDNQWQSKAGFLYNKRLKKVKTPLTESIYTLKRSMPEQEGALRAKKLKWNFGSSKAANDEVGKPTLADTNNRLQPPSNDSQADTILNDSSNLERTRNIESSERTDELDMT